MSRSITVDIYKHVGGNKNERQIVKSGVSVDEKQCMALIKDKSIYVFDTVSGKSITNRNIYDMFAGDGSQTKYYITDDNKIVFNGLTSLPHLFGMPKVGVLPENIDGPNPNTFTAIAPGAFSNVPTGSTAAGTLYNFCDLNSLTEIPAYAFFNNGDPAVTGIPLGVTSVGPHAYDNAIGNGIKSLGSNTALTSIGEWAFANGGYNNTAAPVVIGEGITEIPDYAFYNCPGITEVIFLGNVTKIGKHAFDGCANLEHVSIATATSTGYENKQQGRLPSSLVTIDDYAFNECKKLTISWIDDPTNLTYIGHHAFDRSSNSATGNFYFNFGSKLKFIGDYAFRRCPCGFSNNAYCPATLEYIGNGAFQYMEGSRGSGQYGQPTFKFNASGNLKYIGRNAFEGSSLLPDTIALPASIKYIGYCAFMMTYSDETPRPTAVTIASGANPDYIDSAAFSQSHWSIQKIYVPWSEHQIPGAPWGAGTAYYSNTN